MMTLGSIGGGQTGSDQELVAWEYVGIVTSGGSDIGIPIAVVREARAMIATATGLIETKVSRTGTFEYRMSQGADALRTINVERRDPWLVGPEPGKHDGPRPNLWQRLLRR